MRFILKKILHAIPVLLGVAVLVFFLFQWLGDPSRLLLGQSADAKTRQNIRRDLYLDRPVWQQFLFYLDDISPIAVHSSEQIREKNLQGFFVGGHYRVGIKIPYLRKSYQTKKDAAGVLAAALPATLVLAFTAMLFAVFFGILLGTIAAIKKGKWPDLAAVAGSVAGISAPSFFMAILIAYLFGFVWHRYTGLSITGSLFEIDEVTGDKYLALKNLILPALTLGIRPLAIITQLTRSSLLEVLQQDFIRTAVAKGLRLRTVIWRHAIPNILNPLITAITGWLAELLAGAFFVEYIFGWNGIGKITVDALEKLDYPVVSGAVLLSAVIFVLINILADGAYRLLDPRIK